MQDREYSDLVEALFMDIEDEIDQLEADLDLDLSAGLLNIGFPNGSSVILSRQPVTHEVWVAAKSGGFHLVFDQGRWLCVATNELLGDLLNRVFSEQLGENVGCFQGLRS